MGFILIEEEDDDDLEDDLEVETLDDDDDDGFSEPGESWNWPSALSFIAFVFAVALMWHDCLAH